MLQPSVVERVRATCSGATDRSAASFARTSSRKPSAREKYGSPPRPCVRSTSCSARMASTVDRASGPFVPAFRYARWSSTGKAARASSKVGGKGRASLGAPCAFSSPTRPRSRPQYDHELASALVRAGAEVELVTSPFRFGEPPEPDGYTAQRALLSRQLETLSPLPPPHPGQARRASARACPPAQAQRRRRPRPVACSAGARRPVASPACAARLHRARPAPSPHRRKARPLAAAVRPLRADHRPQRAGARPAGRVDRSRPAPSRLPPGLREQPGTARRRADAPLPRDHPRLQGDGRRDRGRRTASRRSKAPGRRRPARAGGRLPGRGGRQGRVAPRLSLGRRDRPRARRDDGRALPLPAGDRPERRAHARVGRRRAGGGLRRGRPRRAGSHASGPAASSRRATSRRSPRLFASCSTTRTRSRRPERAQSAREAS